MTTPLEVDVAVIGGGLTGLSAALHLVDEGASVALLERGRIGVDSTTARAASGLLLSGLADHASRVARGVGAAAALEIVRFTEESRRIVAALILRRAIECGLARRGAFALAVNEVEAQDLAETHAMLRAAGLVRGAQLLTEADLARLPRTPRGPAALLDPDAVEVDPAALCLGLRDALRAIGGVTLLEGTRVRALDAGGGGVRLEIDEGGGAPDTGGGGATVREVRAQVVVVATNAWADEIHPFFEGRLTPSKGQGFVTAPLPRALSAPVQANWGHELYRQLADGRVVACGFRPDADASDAPLDGAVTEAFQGFLATLLSRRVPGLPPTAEIPVERRFAAPCAETQDGLPWVGPLPGQPAIIAACGLGLRGLSLGAAVGRAVATLITRGERTWPACMSAARATA